MTTAASRYWLLAALAMAFALHIPRLPWWLNAVWVLVLVWRWPAIEQRIPLPNTVVKVLLLLSGISAIRYSYHTVFGPEAGTAFLVFCVALKVVEAKNDRDYYILLTVSLFVLATNFLFGQGLLVTLYAALAVVAITAAYLALNVSHNAQFIIRQALTLLLQALPLMAILFVFFPRLPPLWTLKLTEAGGRTGMSDSMSPGDLASLSQSSELAFRVEFEGNKIPPKSELYWRGLTLSRFDGTTWRVSDNSWLSDSMAAWSGSPLPQWAETHIRIHKQKPLHYKVILEPTDQTWLYSLSVPYSPTLGVGLTRDFRLVSHMPVFQRFSYDARQYRVEALDPQLPNWLYRDTLQLPEAGNPTARAMAHQWRAYYRSDAAYIKAVLTWFGTSPFYYTLEPPPLGQHRIDDFLFMTRRGFCEHYASSFTFLMRAAGIPARVVVGYQGGTPSPTGDSWQVRQMDAHAWVEVWLAGRGWVQLDPTGAVAPERIAQGMSELASNQAVWGTSPMGVIKYGNYKLWGEVRNMVDYLNYRWQRDVIGYNTAEQEDFLLKLLGDSNLWKRLVIMFGSLMLMAGVLAAWMLWRDRKTIHPADKAIVALSVALQKRGLQRQRGEGIIAYLERLQSAQPQWRTQVLMLSQSYSALRYQDTNANRQELQKMARLVRNWPKYHPQSTKEL